MTFVDAAYFAWLPTLNYYRATENKITGQAALHLGHGDRYLKCNCIIISVFNVNTATMSAAHDAYLVTVC